MMQIINRQTKKVYGIYSDVKEAKAELQELGKNYELKKVKTKKN